MRAEMSTDGGEPHMLREIPVLRKYLRIFALGPFDRTLRP